MDKIVLGTYEPTDVYEQPTSVRTESRGLSPHIGSPWLTSYLQQELGLKIAMARKPRAEQAAFDADLVHTHMLVEGGTGAGKSVACREIFRQLIAPSEGRLSYSALIFDVKFSAIERYIAIAREAGVPADSVTVLSPRFDRQPGWNPFLVAGSITQIATDFTNTVEALSPSHAPRMANLVNNTAIIAIAHKLSIFECVRILQRDDFRDRLLQRTIPDELNADDAFAYEEAKSFFISDYAYWTNAEKNSAAAPVVTRLQECLRNRFLASVLLAPTNTLRLPDLWNADAPRVVIVHIDEAVIGVAACRLLMSLLIRSVFRAASRKHGPRNCLLVLDEAAQAEGYFRDVLIDILVLGRSLGVHLMAAIQFGNLLSTLLAQAFSQTRIRIRFRAGSADVGASAASLATDTPRDLSTLWIAESPTPAKTRPRQATVSHVLKNASGAPIHLPPASWPSLEERLVLSRDPLECLGRACRAHGTNELFVEDPMTHTLVKASTYTACLLRTSLRFTGPSPITVVVKFPKPVVKRSDTPSTTEVQAAWSHTLTNLPTRNCVLKVPGQPPRIVRVSQIDEQPASEQDRQYLSIAHRANSQLAEEIDRTLAWRRSVVDPAQSADNQELEEMNDDDSIA